MAKIPAVLVVDQDAKARYDLKKAVKAVELRRRR